MISEVSTKIFREKNMYIRDFYARAWYGTSDEKKYYFSNDQSCNIDPSYFLTTYLRASNHNLFLSQFITQYEILSIHLDIYITSLNIIWSIKIIQFPILRKEGKSIVFEKRYRNVTLKKKIINRVYL